MPFEPSPTAQDSGELKAPARQGHEAADPVPVKTAVPSDPLAPQPGMVQPGIVQPVVVSPATTVVTGELHSVTILASQKEAVQQIETASLQITAAERSITQRIIDDAKRAEPHSAALHSAEDARTPKIDISTLVVVTTEASKSKSSGLAYDQKNSDEKLSLLFSRPSDSQAKEQKSQEPQKSALLELKPNELKPLAEQKPFEARERPVGLVQEKPPAERALEAVRESKQERVSELEGIKRAVEPASPVLAQRSPSEAVAPAPAASAPVAPAAAPVASPVIKVNERQAEAVSPTQHSTRAIEPAVHVRQQVIEKITTPSSTRIEVIRVETPVDRRVATVSSHTPEVTTRVVMRNSTASTSSSPIEVVYRFVAAVRDRFSPASEVIPVRSVTTAAQAPRSSAITPDYRATPELRRADSSQKTIVPQPGSPVTRTARDVGSAPGITRAPTGTQATTSSRSSSPRVTNSAAVGRDMQPRASDRSGKETPLSARAVIRSQSRAAPERVSKALAAHHLADRKQSQLEARRTTDIVRQEKTTMAGTKITRISTKGVELAAKPGTTRERLLDKLRFSDGTPVEKVVREVARAVKNLFQPLAADTEIAPVVKSESDLEEMPKDIHARILEPEGDLEHDIEAKSTIPQDLEKERFPKLDPLKDEPIAIYTIRGSVFDNDSGVPEAGVIIRSGLLGTTTTDSNGNYSFENVPEGTFFIITAHARGVRFHPGFASGTVSGHTIRDFRAIVLTH
jgi:hypothetical protein